MKRILLTGMSGTGKSSVITALAALGYKAVDLDSHEYSHWVTAHPSDTLTPEPGRDWVWQEDRVQELLSKEDAEQLFVSGCAENMGRFLPQFDHIILLSAHPEILVKRLATRTNNNFGKQPHELAQVLTLQQTIEPLLRKSAGHEIDSSAPLNNVITQVLRISAL
jgi:dephospho-CoA kinase